MSAEPVLHLVVTHAARAVDAEDAVDEQVRRRGFRLAGDHPRYQLGVDEGARAALAGGALSESLQALLTDLVHDDRIRSLGIAWQTGAKSPDPGDAARLEIGDFIAQARRAGLTPDRWYRLHAPAGFRCRPKGFA